MKALQDNKLNVAEIMETVSAGAETITRKGNKSGKLSQDTPVLPQVVKLGHAPDKIQV